MHEHQVRELMTDDVVTVGPDTSFKQLVQLLSRHRVDAVPVVQDGRLLGVVSASDLTAHDEQPPSLVRTLLGGRHERDHARTCRGRTARELMSSPARCVRPDAPVPEALREMTRGRVGRLVVVEDGAVLGILTRSDVLSVYLREDALLERDVAEVVRRAVHCDAEVTTTVRDGVARLEGWVERASCGWAAAAAVRALPGVVDVDDLLTYRVDDTLVEEVAMRQYV